jgi:uncharacterized membrane protein/2-hydroxychromene-2-carboxylate isomerase
MGHRGVDRTVEARRGLGTSGLRGRRTRIELAAVLGLGLAGIVVSVVLARLHAQAHAGASSFCAVSETVNCDRVALSRHSVQLGLPVAVWGGLGYAVIAGLAASGMARRRADSTWPTGLLFLASAAAATASAVLALVSKFAIGAWCPLCVVSWAISAALLAIAWRACRNVGAGGAILADLSAAWARPLRSIAAILPILAAVASTVAAYPRYWDRGRVPSRAAAFALGAEGERASPGERPLVVFEYTDYECPFCARMHEETSALAGRSDVVLVRRHFPLDPACNPGVKRRIHASACDLARAGICAEEQGRLADMEDALFANQRDRLPVEALATRVGLDLVRFLACVASPETGRRLAADVAAGMRDGVRATPSYVVRGRVHAGRFPAELLELTDARHGG